MTFVTGKLIHLKAIALNFTLNFPISNESFQLKMDLYKNRSNLMMFPTTGMPSSLVLGIAQMYTAVDKHILMHVLRFYLKGEII